MTAVSNAVLTEGDLAILRDAHFHLEHPSLAARLTNFVGLPLERGMRLLPRRWYEAVRQTPSTMGIPSHASPSANLFSTWRLGHLRSWPLPAATRE